MTVVEINLGNRQIVNVVFLTFVVDGAGRVGWRGDGVGSAGVRVGVWCLPGGVCRGVLQGGGIYM